MAVSFEFAEADCVLRIALDGELTDPNPTGYMAEGNQGRYGFASMQNYCGFVRYHGC